jgi:hypothetical protein
VATDVGSSAALAADIEIMALVWASGDVEEVATPTVATDAGFYATAAVASERRSRHRHHHHRHKCRYRKNQNHAPHQRAASLLLRHRLLLLLLQSHHRFLLFCVDGFALHPDYGRCGETGHRAKVRNLA